jgi:hypothetical protein
VLAIKTGEFMSVGGGKIALIGFTLLMASP